MNEKAQKALQVAVEKGKVAEVKKALAAGADLHFEDPEADWAAIHLAAVHGQTEVVKLLLSLGAKVNSVARGFTPLHLAAQYGDPAMVTMLLKAGADIEGRQKNALSGETPLAEALEAKRIDNAEVLIKAGANFTARDNWNRTLVHKAASENVAKLIPLLAKKVDVNAVDKSGGSPLATAAYFGHLDAMEALLKLKAKPEVCSFGRQGDRGGAAIHCAAEGGQLKALERLLKAGVSLEAPSSRGETPLVFAVRGEEPLKTVKALLALGANVNAKSKKGVTALMIAVQEGLADVVKLLLSKGADATVTVKETTAVNDPKGAMQMVYPGATLADMAKLMKRSDLLKLVSAK